jgi:hypothetical protein
MAPVFVGLIIVSQRGVLRLLTCLPCAPAQGWRWSRIARTLNPHPGGGRGQRMRLCGSRAHDVRGRACYPRQLLLGRVHAPDCGVICAVRPHDGGRDRTDPFAVCRRLQSSSKPAISIGMRSPRAYFRRHATANWQAKGSPALTRML